MDSERLSRREFLRFGGETLLLSAAKFLEKKVQSPEAVWFDEQGVMFVNGKRFFPKVLYGLPGEHTKQQSWQLAKDAGFNTITMFFPTPLAFLHADSNDLKTLVRLDYAFPGFEPNEAELKRLQAEPSVIAWEVDEPSSSWPESRLRFLSWLADRSLLPLRVTTYSGARLLSDPKEVGFLSRLYATYPNIISGPDAYNYTPEIEIDAYDDYCDQQRALGRTEIKTLWQVTSAHTQDEVYFARDLVYDDIYYQTISGIVAGARGVGFYDSPWGCDLDGCGIAQEKNGVVNVYAQNFEHLRRINKLLESVETALVGVEIFRGSYSKKNIRIFADAYEPRKYWEFSSNPETREVSICSFTKKLSFF